MGFQGAVRGGWLGGHGICSRPLIKEAHRSVHFLVGLWVRGAGLAGWRDFSTLWVGELIPVQQEAAARNRPPGALPAQAA